jgi:cytochrome c oxidase subunit 4
MAHGASGTVHVVADHAEHEHPGERTYIRVAAVLAIITVIEVAIYYLNFPHTVLVTALLFFSAVKFATVVGYFMHLKFDDRRLLYIFAGGLLVGGSILLALDALQHFHSIEYGRDILTTQETSAEHTE